LILCRNVLIYFTPELQRRALQLFAFALRDGGNLVLGKSESTSAISGSFAIEEAQLKIFRRTGDRILIPSARIETVPATQSARPRPLRRVPAPEAPILLHGRPEAGPRER